MSKTSKHAMFSRSVALQADASVVLICTSCRDQHCGWRGWSPSLHVIEVAEQAHTARHTKGKSAGVTKHGSRHPHSK